MHPIFHKLTQHVAYAGNLKRDMHLFCHQMTVITLQITILMLELRLEELHLDMVQILTKLKLLAGCTMLVPCIRILNEFMQQGSLALRYYLKRSSSR
ncbi:hypothetical protein PAV_6c04580 [Paenibacillus alvei DSM 29]|nr:hypothetical protein PAV_6c04580 [Paenibacillus alvei DSM 29]